MKDMFFILTGGFPVLQITHQMGDTLNMWFEACEQIVLKFTC